MRGNFGNKCVHVRVHWFTCGRLNYLAASKNLDGFCAMHKTVILLHEGYGARGQAHPRGPRAGRLSSRLARGLMSGTATLGEAAADVVPVCSGERIETRAEP
jgi:hypothetical protein